MANEKIKLTWENHGNGGRYRKMFHRKTWTSKTYPQNSRRNKSEAWGEFKEWREDRRREALSENPKAKRWQEVIDATKLLLKRLRNEGDRRAWGFWNDQLAIYRLYATGERFDNFNFRLDKDCCPIFEPDPENIDSFPIFIVSDRQKFLPQPWDNEPDPATPEMTGRAVVTGYLATLEKEVNAGTRSTGAYSKVRSALECFLKWFGGERGMDTITEDDVTSYHLHMLELIEKKTNSRSTISGYWGAWKTFLNHICDDNPDIPRPSNLGSRRYSIKPGSAKVEVFTVDECKMFLDLASDRVELWLRLMLNCGFYQGDISDLLADEVDWDEGRIIRARSKEKDAPTINWKLWPETFELLKEQGSREGRVFSVTEGKNAGEPLVASSIKSDGKESRRDAINSSWKHLVGKAIRHKSVPEGWNKSLKQLRKTGATLIEGSSHAEFVDMFLDHSRIAKRHYTRPGQIVPKFDEAIEWLGKQFES